MRPGDAARQAQPFMIQPQIARIFTILHDLFIMLRYSQDQ